MSTRVWALVLALSLSIAIAIPSGPSKADGATDTFNELTGLQLLFQIGKWKHAEYVADQNKAAATIIMQTDMMPTASPATSTLEAMRANVLKAVANVSPATVPSTPPTPPGATAPVPPRLQYESLRACWNSLIFATAQLNDTSRANLIAVIYPTPTPTPTPTPKPTPTPNPKAKPGTTRTHTVVKPHAASSTSSTADAPPGASADVSACVQTAYIKGLSRTKFVYDALDELSAFSGPSLSAQIGAGTVQSYAYEDLGRAAVVYTLAQTFVASIESADNTARVDALPDLKGLYKDCFGTTRGALDCASNLAGLEQALESAYRKKQSCDFARDYWLPSFTAIKQKPQPATPPPGTAPLKVDYGPVPGCSS